MENKAIFTSITRLRINPNWSCLLSGETIPALNGLEHFNNIVHFKRNEAITKVLPLTVFSFFLSFFYTLGSLGNTHALAYFFFCFGKFFKKTWSSLSASVSSINWAQWLDATANQCNIASNHKRGRHHLFYSQWLDIRTGSHDWPKEERLAQRRKGCHCWAICPKVYPELGSKKKKKNEVLHKLNARELHTNHYWPEQTSLMTAVNPEAGSDTLHWLQPII